MSASPQRAGWNNPFIAATDLKPGEYGQFSKLSVRRLTYVDWPLHTRIYALLFLQCFGYDGELGLIMSKSKFPRQAPTAAPLTPRAITVLLEKAGIEGYQVAQTDIDDDAKAAIRIDRYQLRDALQHLENKGLISRCQVNCPPTVLLNHTFFEALEKRLITEFRDLSTKQRQALQASKITVYLLAHPRKPKSMQPYRDSVGTSPHCPPQGADSKSDKRGGVQLFLEFVGDRKLAEKLLQRPAVRKEIDEYDRRLAEVRGSVEKMREEEHALIKKLRTFAEQAAQLNLFDDTAVPFPSLPSVTTEASVATKSVPAVHVDEVAAVQTAMEKWVACDAALAASTIAECRELTPDATLEEILAAINEAGEKMQHTSGVKLPGPYLRRAAARTLSATQRKNRGEAWKRRAEEARKVAMKATACKTCGGSGLVNEDWETVGELVAKVRAGAQYCTCEEGAMAKDHAEPAILRSVS